MRDLVDSLIDIVGAAHVTAGGAVSPDDTHDECLTLDPVAPLAVVRPASTEEVVAIVRLANERRLPLVPRGSATGLSGGSRPLADGVVVAFDRMDRILEIDRQNHVAVVQPGVTLAQLDAETARHDLVYPVFPGENSASLGGNVATNAGGMRAVKYGVTRNHVLGLQVVLASGDVLRTGGKYVKASTGYDLTQLLVGSEGTLALVTEVTCKLHPRLGERATILAPFRTLAEVAAAVPRLIDSGVGPLMLEYIDMLTMSAATQAAGLDLGIPDGVREQALAYLVVALESAHADRLDDDVQHSAELLDELGAMDVYVLPAQAAEQLISARERAFFVAKALGADDIIDVVVPRAVIPEYLAAVADLAREYGALVAGCGHAGDGNVHLSVFQPDPVKRHAVLHGIFALGMELGGAISGEHGLGVAKQEHFLELEDPVKIALLRRLKAAFDPNGILNPATSLGPDPSVAPAPAAAGQALA